MAITGYVMQLGLLGEGVSVVVWAVIWDCGWYSMVMWLRMWVAYPVNVDGTVWDRGRERGTVSGIVGDCGRQCGWQSWTVDGIVWDYGRYYGWQCETVGGNVGAWLIVMTINVVWDCYCSVEL